MMAPGLRRFTFTTHITSSLGWVGAVLAFLALTVIALTSEDEITVRGAHLVMAPAAWFVLVPLAHASLLSGIAPKVAADPVVELGLVRNPSPAVHAILALILLMTATVLGVYKPFGTIPPPTRRTYLAGAGAVAVAIILLFSLLHFIGPVFQH